MEKDGLIEERDKAGISAYKLSYFLFAAFLLTASMNRTSVYQNFTVPDFFLSLSFLIVVTSFFISGFFPANFFIHNNPLWAPGILFIFSCLLAILVGPKFHLVDSFLVLIQFIFIFFVMVPIFRFHFFKQARKVASYAESVAVLILISGLFACLVAILREYVGVSILNASVTRMGRHGSYMGQPGNFSQYLTLVWPFALHFFLVGTLGKKFLGITGMCLFSWGVFLSASRFAFVAIPLVSCFYLGCRALYTREGWRKFVYGFVITMVVSAIVWSIYSFLQDPSRLKSLISSISITTAMEKKLSQFYTALETGTLASFDPKRAFFTSKALDFLRSLPLLGIGLDNARYVLGFRVHILFLTVWIEGGILALLSAVIIYWRVIKAGIKDLRNCKNYREVSSISAFLASCAGGLLMIFRTPMVFQNRYYWIPYLVVLFLAVFNKTQKNLAPHI
jgi:hypothetical protein